jgi:hypothetical protein
VREGEWGRWYVGVEFMELRISFFFFFFYVFCYFIHFNYFVLNLLLFYF